MSQDATSQEGMPEIGEKGKYRMTVSLNVLRHLGLNLYSNVPAVLSEAVANAWDADAEIVDIDIDTESQIITITDDGHGMSESDINERYLYVGYRRRDDDDRPSVTPEHGRPVMGRKGIGKLSLFSIARIVEVYTTDGSDENAFRMDVEEMRRKMEEEDLGGEAAIYYPEEIPDFPDDLNPGTRVILRDLKKEVQNKLTEKYLRRRLARRFGILGEEYQFEMILNGEPVTFDDRDYFHKLQLLFHYGPNSEQYVERCDNLEYEEKREHQVNPDYEINGWIGTAERPSQLKDNSDDLNKVSVMMRGKLAQEDILEDTNVSEFFSEYVIGVIHADFLDIDDGKDIATSDREHIIKDDPRYEALREFVETELRHVGNVWNDFRAKKGEEEAREIPVINEWFESLSEPNQERARDLFGKINQMSVDDEENKRRLFKYGILAFESLRYRDDLDQLDRISPDNVEQLTSIFSDLDDIEAILYHQIVSQRLDVIEELRSKIEEGALDQVLQEYIHDHPWLLDPSWERATGAGDIEDAVRQEFKEVDKDISPEERQGRVEVRYIRTTEQHVIIDLRDSNRVFTRGELVNQLSKYRTALKRVLKEFNRGDDRVEIVSIIGEDLEDWKSNSDREETSEMLEAINARVLKYEELLNQAAESYKRYMEEREKVNRIQKVLNSIDAEDAF